MRRRRSEDGRGERERGGGGAPTAAQVARQARTATQTSHEKPPIKIDPALEERHWLWSLLRSQSSPRTSRLGLLQPRESLLAQLDGHAAAAARAAAGTRRAAGSRRCSLYCLILRNHKTPGTFANFLFWYGGDLNAPPRR